MLSGRRDAERVLWALYAVTVLVWVAALFRTRLLPSVDYPQHLALAALLRRWFTPGSAEHALYETNLVSYNGGFHVATALLGSIVSIEIAGKLVVAMVGIALAAAHATFVVRAGRPASRAFAVVPVLGGYWFAWGFVNFAAGLGAGLFLASRMIPKEQVPGLRSQLLTVALAVFTCWLHLLAAAVTFALAGVIVVARAPRTSARAFIDFIARGLWPFSPAVCYAAFVYVRQERAWYRNYEYAVIEGTTVSVGDKLALFARSVTGLRRDGWDAVLVWALLAVLLACAVVRERDDRPAAWCFAALGLPTALYLVLPHTLWATNFVFPRFAAIVLMAAAWSAPRARGRVRALAEALVVALGVVSAGVFWASMNAARRELSDLAQLVDRAPPNLRVIGVVWRPSSPSFAPPILLHAPAWYVAIRGGESAFSFSRTMSLPLHYRASQVPPALPFNFEWSPQAFRSDAPYARYFDVVFLKTAGPTDPPGAALAAATGVGHAIRHSGPYWLIRLDPAAK